MRWMMGFLVACSGRLDPVPESPAAESSDEQVPVVVSDEDVTGLHLTLTQTSASDAGGDRLVAGEVLAEPSLKKLLSRAGPLPESHSDRRTFARPEKSLAPPQPGTIESIEPPSTDRPTPRVPSGAVKVLRYRPEGEVPIAPKLSVSFDRPMVAVSSVEVTEETVPVTLDPPQEGVWRWLGTQTLVFEPSNRLPMATDYTVRSRDSARAADGQPLAEPLSWTFSTPPPTVRSVSPGGDRVDLSPLITLQFDQPMNPAQVVAKVSGNATLRLATEEERKNQNDAATRVYLKPMNPLSPNTRYAFSVETGLVGLEGPRASTQPHAFEFKTYPPLKVLPPDCAKKECPNYGSLQFRTTTNLANTALTKDNVRVSPEVEDLEVIGSGRYHQLRGSFKPRTTYTVTVEKGLTDTHGQVLRSDATMRIPLAAMRPEFTIRTAPFMVLDPLDTAPSIPVFTRGLKDFRLRVYDVGPDDLMAFYQQDKEKGSYVGIGTLRLDRVVKLDGDPDVVTDHAIELAEFFPKKTGQRVLFIEATDGDRTWSHRVWVQSTRIGVDAFVDRKTLVASATDLATGRALKGVKVTLWHPGTLQNTDADGLARFDLPDEVGHPGVVVAERGDDLALLPSAPWGSQPWWKREGTAHPVWFTFDDRGLYKPGETVTMRGLHRLIEPGAKGDVAASPLTSVTWVAKDPRGLEIGKGEAVVKDGGFGLSFDVPEGANLGMGWIEVDGDGHTTHHRYQIAEFRRPTFEVSATLESAPHVVGTHAKASVQASYFAGGGLAGATTDWNVTTQTTTYRPAGHDGFNFGTFQPWWWWGWRQPRQGIGYNLSGKTDITGAHHMDVFFEKSGPHATSITLRATVTDVDRQQFTATASSIVHPAARYIGIRGRRAFFQAGQDIELEAVVTDIEGTLSAGQPVTVEAVRTSWRWKEGQWQHEEAERHRCDLESETAAVVCAFTPEGAGRFSVTATVVDDAGRRNQSELSVWVQGGAEKSAKRVELERVLLIPDQDSYAGGQVAKIFIQSPFAPADAVVRIEREDFIEVRQVRLDEGSTTIEVPIEEAMTPGVQVQVEVTGSAPRGDAEIRRPAYAQGRLKLDVPPLQRVLDVTVTPRESTLTPGADTGVSVGVVDAGGKPLSGAEVTVWVVDESVLAMAGYDLADPVAPFYPQRRKLTADHRFRDMVKLAEPDAPAKAKEMMKRASPGGMPTPSPMVMEAEEKAADMDDGGGDADAAIQVRSNFSALALWKGSATTDRKGQLSISYTLPDNLTRYRVLAVASDGVKRFGSGESSVTARNPLMVRPSAPRFLNFGDRFELPVVLQNQTDAPMTVQLGAQAFNAVFLTSLDQKGDPYEVGSERTGRTVTVPANDRIEVRLPTSTDMAGTARFQFVASAGDASDAARIEIPVWTPATGEAFATYGVIDDGAISQPVSTPGDVWTQFGGLEISTSSTALQALTDAVIELVEYPYGCSEQIASRVLAVVALRDVLEAFDADGMPDGKALDKMVKEDLERLAQLQGNDGGFGFWRRNERSWPFVSLHVAHTVARAQQKGIEIPETLLTGVERYVAKAPQNFPSQMGKAQRDHLHAYALFISELLGKPRQAEAVRLVGNARLEAKGWLLPTLPEAQQAAVLREISNRTEETAAAAHFVASYDEQDTYVLLASNRRLDGVLLDALIRVDPENALIPKVVTGLLNHKVAGHWGSTQDNAFVLLALDHYFRTFEKVEPDFVARAWLGKMYAGAATFEGREAKTARIDIPMGELTEDPSRNLVLAKDGPGRLYYRIGLRYAPRSLSLDALDRGFNVTRRYEAIDSPEDVTFSDGVWTVKEGASVRVTVEMVADGRRVHVAMEDPLPAGFEALNPELQGTAPVADDPTDHRWWTHWWVHDNLRDERAEAFAYQLYGGVYSYSYVARATTPGRFVVPPAKAEEMYNPETFGRSASTVVVVAP